jgi:branched-chain amino acid transport system substrate-binding protein
MKTKMWLCFAAALVFLLSLPGDVCAQPAKEPIKVGIIRDLTGPHAEAGRSEKDALIFVYDRVNEKGGIGGHMIKYFIGDDKADPDTSMALAKRFVEVEKVVILSDCTTSSSGMAITKYGSEVKVPVFGEAISMALFEGERGHWYFGDTLTNEDFTRVSLFWAQKRGYKRVGVIYINNKFGQDWSSVAVKEGPPKFGLQILGPIPIEAGASESTAEVTKMKNMNPEALLLCTYPKDQAAVGRAMAALDWHPPTMGTGPTLLPAIKMAGPAPFEGWSAGFYIDNPEAPDVLALLKEFKDKYGYLPPDTGYFMNTHDGVRVQVHVLETMVKMGIPLTGSNIRDACEKYSGGVDVRTPAPRKTKGWNKPPHHLIEFGDIPTLTIRNGKAVLEKK